jgi:DNA repair exonuclease SbcCD nuclease subunit
VVVEVRGTRVAFAGFPYERRDVRTSLPQLVHATGWETHTADLHLLCVHHCFEGATVGPSDYTFTTASDVIRHADVPTGFSAVLTGHIHRHQVLTRDLRGAPLRVPVLYPGSIERTALAELGEAKGYLRLRASPGRPLEWEFCELPARPMIRAELSAVAHPDDALDATIRKLVADAPLDAVISIRISGTLDPAHRRAMSAGHLRTFVPRTMNVEVSTERELHASRRSSTEAQTDDPQLDLLQNMTGDVAPEGDEPEDSLFGSDDTYAPR